MALSLTYTKDAQITGISVEITGAFATVTISFVEILRDPSGTIISQHPQTVVINPSTFPALTLPLTNLATFLNTISTTWHNQVYGA